MERNTKLAVGVGCLALAAMLTVGVLRERDDIRAKHDVESAEKQAKDLDDKIVANTHQIKDLIPRVADALLDIKKALRVSEAQAATAVNTKLLPLLDQLIALQTDAIRLWEVIPADHRSDMVVDGTKSAHAFLARLQSARAKFAAAGARLAQGDASSREISDMFDDAGMTLAQP